MVNTKNPTNKIFDGTARATCSARIKACAILRCVVRESFLRTGLEVRLNSTVWSRARESLSNKTINSDGLTGSSRYSTCQNECAGTTRTPEYKNQYGLDGISVWQVATLIFQLGCLYLYRICAPANSVLSMIASSSLSCVADS